MPQHQKDAANAQKDVQKRYQIELSRYQKQIEKRRKLLASSKGETNQDSGCCK